ncbi:MAG: SDR family NAD(P)-dependent oxidoreductase [Planctomycetales bacterium]|nr:SDR family NAD(P)-dependent oxidoreductase [Planctomycetales bacterium]
MSRRSLPGSRVLITGASSGIGRCLAIELARQQCDLVLLARRREKLIELTQELSPYGHRVELVIGDLVDPAVRRRALEVAVEHLGGLDMLVNNAGISAHGRFADAGKERLRKIMDVNFFAAVEFTREALGLLKQGRQPIVVNVGSILGHRAIPHNSEYCASKFALRGWSESLRPELATVGVDLLLVSPGTTETEFFEHLIDKQGELPWKSGRGVSPERVARATVRAIERGKREIVPSWPGRLLLWANRLAPWLVDRAMRKYG